MSKLSSFVNRESDTESNNYQRIKIESLLLDDTSDSNTMIVRKIENQKKTETKVSHLPSIQTLFSVIDTYDSSRDSCMNVLDAACGQPSIKAAAQFYPNVLKNPKRPHVCPICLKRFVRPSTLTTHKNSHTGEQPFVCDYSGCDKKFSVLSNMRRHMKLHED